MVGAIVMATLMGDGDFPAALGLLPIFPEALSGLPLPATTVRFEMTPTTDVSDAKAVKLMESMLEKTR